MPTLHNPTAQDLHCNVTGEIVPAGGSVEISDEQAERVNTATGIWTVTRAASRETVKRGSKRAEINTAPPMETR